ncbi:MAG: hypothetical protein CMJ78_04860 [Planctomycetaceae bacterium]|nr:hypothetical protein [Planctomycetaceae bacterium]
MRKAAKQLSVSRDGTAGPYIIVPVDQLEDLVSLLDQNSVNYWVDEVAVSYDGKPYTSVINLDHDTDCEKVRKILDSAI